MTYIKLAHLNDNVKVRYLVVKWREFVKAFNNKLINTFGQSFRSIYKMLTFNCMCCLLHCTRCFYVLSPPKCEH